MPEFGVNESQGKRNVTYEISTALLPEEDREENRPIIGCVFIANNLLKTAQRAPDNKQSFYVQKATNELARVLPVEVAQSIVNAAFAGNLESKIIYQATKEDK